MAHRSQDKCRDRLELYSRGQDENIYTTDALEGEEWEIQEVLGSRKKNEGRGGMFLAFRYERCGFGWPLLEEQLECVNVLRRKRARAEI